MQTLCDKRCCKDIAIMHSKDSARFCKDHLTDILIWKYDTNIYLLSGMIRTNMIQIIKYILHDTNLNILYDTIYDTTYDTNKYILIQTVYSDFSISNYIIVHNLWFK